MNLLLQLKTFSQSRLSWLILFVFTVFFNLCAYCFQHLLKLDPCVMCVYERVAMIGIGFAALIGLINPQNVAFRWAGFTAWAATAYKGLILSIEHVGYQTNIFATCEPLRFPAWAPLDKWVPSFFAAPGDCSEVVWQFMTLSMPQWLVVIYAANLIALAIIIVSQFSKQK